MKATSPARGILACYGVLLAVSIVPLWSHGASLCWRGSWTALAEQVLLGSAVGLAFVGLSRWLAAGFAWAAALEQEFRPLALHIGRRGVFSAALASSVVEELFFRGVVQQALGLWFASAVFGLLHVGPNRRFRAWTLMAAVAGIALGFLFESTGTLVAPIAAHFVTNFLNLRHLTRSTQGPQLSARYDFA